MKALSKGHAFSVTLCDHGVGGGGQTEFCFIFDYSYRLFFLHRGVTLCWREGHSRFGKESTDKHLYRGEKTSKKKKTSVRKDETENPQMSVAFGDATPPS